MKREFVQLGWCRGAGLAALCAILTCSAAGHAELPPAPTHEVDPSPEARHEFQLGVDMLQDPDGARYEEAFLQFMRAYTLSPSWKILGNLGLSAFKLERFADGIEAYQRYLKAAGPDLDPAERQQIERDLEFMKSSSASLALTLTGAAGGPLSIQDTRQRAVGGPIINVYELPAGQAPKLRLMAGTHTLQLTAGQQHATLEINLQAGETTARTVDLSSHAAPAPGPAAPPVTKTAAVPPPTSSSGLRSTGFVLGGVGVLAVVGGVVTFVLGSSKKSDLEKRCPQNTCSYASPEEKQAFEDDKSSLKTLGFASTALLVGGGVLAATGATLFVLGGHSERPTVALGAAPLPAGFAFSARGTF